MQELTPARRGLVSVRKSRIAALLVACAIAVGIAIPAYSKGLVLLGELVLLGMFFALVPTITRSRFLTTTWAVCLLWFLVQIISDWVHGTRIFSGVTLTGPTTALLATGLCWVYTKYRLSAAAILSAVGVGWIGLTVLAGDAIVSSNPWKYGFSTPVVVTALAFSQLRGVKRGTTVLLLLVLAGISLQFDSRFETGLLLVCALAMLITASSRKISKRGRWSVLVVVALGAAMYLAYPSVALSGLIGERAYLQQVLYESQGANFLLATRLEFPQMIYLVGQNPILGIGSHGHLSATEAYAALEWLNNNIAPLSGNAQDYLLNPTEGYPGYNSHSSAMGSALFAGILAIPFWVFLLVSTFRSLFRFTQGAILVPSVVLYMGGVTIWNSLFSPLTYASHVALAVMVFLCSVTLDPQAIKLSPLAGAKGETVHAKSCVPADSPHRL